MPCDRALRRRAGWLRFAEPWDPSSAEVSWEDGRMVRAEVVRPRTTRSGPVPQGAVIRLVLRLEEDGPREAPGRVIVTTARGRLTVVLGR